jgi:hypothetical protein
MHSFCFLLFEYVNALANKRLGPARKFAELQLPDFYTISAAHLWFLQTLFFLFFLITMHQRAMHIVTLSHKENFLFRSMRPKTRGLAQHGGPPGWLEESDPSGVILNVMDAPYACLSSTVPAALAGAAQLRADGISSCCYLVKNTTIVMSRVATKISRNEIPRNFVLFLFRIFAKILGKFSRNVT